MPKVCIDPGHGGNDPGSVSGARTEKSDNLKLALLLNSQFLAQGWDTVLTRTDDNSIILANRTALANKEHCSIYLSCHRNGAIDTSANGCEIWLHSKAPLRYIQWAGDILEQIEPLGFKNRGVKLGYRNNPSADYAVNRDTDMPSMLLEVGFITNIQDNKLFDEKLEAICRCIVKGCCSFTGVSYAEQPEQKPEGPTDKSYMISLKDLKEQGYTRVEISL